MWPLVRFPFSKVTCNVVRNLISAEQGFPEDKDLALLAPHDPAGGHPGEEAANGEEEGNRANVEDGTELESISGMMLLFFA